MNFRLRQERNAFVFLIVVAMPLVLLTAPLPYLTALSNQKAATGGTQAHQKAKAKAPAKHGSQARS
jgi:hypothetical protein